LLGGYSFGGVIAFEIAQQLLREKQEVALLALLDTQALNGHRNSTGAASAVETASGHFASVQKRLAKLPTYRLREIPLKALRCLEDFGTVTVARFMDKLSSPTKKALCRIYLATGRPIPPSLRSTYILNVYRKAGREYAPRPYPGRVIYFKSRLNVSDPVLSWGALVQGGFTVFEVPGDHLDIREGPYIGAWASILKEKLTSAQEKRSLQPTPFSATVYLSNAI
jgi:thioesterase domain-containing protein